MAFDSVRADGAVVELLDTLSGVRVVGLGVRLAGDVVATSCRCLPRHFGRPHLPDPDAPTVPVLVHLRRPGAAEVACAVVAAADPCSGLALLQAARAAGLDVPEELNPVVSVEELLEGVAAALPEPRAPADGPAWLRAADGRWLPGAVRGAEFCPAGDASEVAAPGAPVVGEEGRVLGVAAFGGALQPTAALCLLSEALPGWVLRAAAHQDKPAHSTLWTRVL
jgi:hypothetical protein